MPTPIGSIGKMASSGGWDRFQVHATRKRGLVMKDRNGNQIKMDDQAAIGTATGNDALTHPTGASIGSGKAALELFPQGRI